MDHYEIEQMIQKTVHETLFQIGILVDNNNDIAEFRQDMVYVRGLRKTTDNIKKRSAMATVTVLVTAFFGAIWMAIQSFLHLQSMPNSP